MQLLGVSGALAACQTGPCMAVPVRFFAWPLRWHLKASLVGSGACADSQSRLGYALDLGQRDPCLM